LFFIFSLYVSVLVLEFPQECNGVQLLFGFALFFGVCYGVVTAFFFTRGTWVHAEEATVWL
jgi:hypothetical protein